MSISQERIKELAHRRATKYTHRSAPHESAFGFTDSHLDDLCRDIHAAIEAECLVPEGWIIERSDRPPFKRITIKTPNGYSCICDSVELYPENILYMLAEALIAAAPQPSQAEPECECGAVATEHCPSCSPDPVAQEPVAFMNAHGKPVSAKWLKHHALEREQDEYTIPLYTAPHDLAAEVERLLELLATHEGAVQLFNQQWAEYLKEDEEPLDRLKREIADCHAVLGLLAEGRERIAELEAALREAKEMVESWGAYASPYFQAKHDLVGDIATIDKVLGGNAVGQQEAACGRSAGPECSAAHYEERQP